MGPSTEDRIDQVKQTESPTKPDLQTLLHTATRAKHANLNRTITNRLPLCLPPRTATPLPYHLGMLVFGSIYQQLEQAIDEIREEQTPDLRLNQNRHRHVELVERLFTEGLARTQLLKHDAKVLHARLSQNLTVLEGFTISLEEMENYVQGQVDAAAGKLQIYGRIKTKPYLSLAYAWAMYLALFNGGRWLLQQLRSAGPEFWLEEGEQGSTLQSIETLSFWHFEAATVEDPNADKLKMGFKQNFDAASSMLTEEETAEVVQEGTAVFDTCSRLIEILEACARDIELHSESRQPQVDNPKTDDEASVSPMWQTLEAAVLVPAYQIMRRLWTQSFRRDVSIAAG